MSAHLIQVVREKMIEFKPKAITFGLKIIINSLEATHDFLTAIIWGVLLGVGGFTAFYVFTALYGMVR